MKNLLFLCFTITLVCPLTVDAAWYWLLNPANPEQGDFVQMSALEYAESEISKNLLVYIEDDFKKLLDKAQDYQECESEYDDFMYLLQRLTTTTYATDYKSNDFHKCIDAGEVREALNECDMKYIAEELSDGQKVIYNKEISSCKAELHEQSVVTVATSPVQTQPAQQTAVPQQIVPIILPTTQAAPAVNDLDAPSEPTLEHEEIKSEYQNINQMSVDEVNVEEKQGSEVAIMTESDVSAANKQNFFQKIVNFFSRLLSW